MYLLKCNYCPNIFYRERNPGQVCCFNCKQKRRRLTAINFYKNLISSPEGKEKYRKYQREHYRNIVAPRKVKDNG